jgi:hypothetical protein
METSLEVFGPGEALTPGEAVALLFLEFMSSASFLRLLPPVPLFWEVGSAMSLCTRFI